MPYKNKDDQRKSDAKRRNTEHRRQYRVEWYKKNGHKNYIRDRSYNLKKTYGITLEWYEETLAAQGGGCKICGRSPKGRQLSVDHDHNSGKVRGLICYYCNTGLGNFKDDADLLRRALAYLTAFDEVN